MQSQWHFYNASDNSRANGLNSALGSLGNLIDNGAAGAVLKGTGTAVANGLSVTGVLGSLLHDQNNTSAGDNPKAYLNVLFVGIGWEMGRGVNSIPWYRANIRPVLQDALGATRDEYPKPNPTVSGPTSNKYHKPTEKEKKELLDQIQKQLEEMHRRNHPGSTLEPSRKN